MLSDEEKSIDTYIEKSKPYWEQIMTKDEMTIEEALTIIDDMYQDKYKIMEQKTDTGVTIDLSKMDKITFTNLEFASVIVLREIQSLRHEMEKQSKEIEELKEDNQRYKRIASQKLDDIEEFRKNECEHRCIRNAEVLELKEYYQENYTPNDKIKAKIEELENQKRQWIEDRDNKHKDSEIIYAKKVLESLLEYIEDKGE